MRQFLFFINTHPDADWGDAMLHLKRNLPFNETTMRDPNLPSFMSKSIAEDRLTIDAYSLFGDPAARVLAPGARTANFMPKKDAESPTLTLTLGGKWDPATLAGEIERPARLLEAMRYATGGGGKKPASAVQHEFTPREASVLQLVAEGMMNKEIARRLETSIRNVEKYVSRLFTKTGTASRTELVRYALEHGLVD